jgi:hypothetical protein
LQDLLDGNLPAAEQHAHASGKADQLNST